MRVRRWLAALAALGLSACGGTADLRRADTVTTSPPAVTAAPTSRAARVATARQMKAALLSIDDLPTGWSVDTEDDDDDDSFGEGCKPLAALDEAFEDGPESAEIEFAQGELGPYLAEAVDSLPAAKDVTRRIAALKRAMNACPSFEYEDDDGKKQKVKVAPVSFPRLGDETFAVRLTIEFEGGRMSMTLVVVRVRNHAMLIAGISATTVFGGGQLAPETFEKIVRTAVKKATGALP